MPPCEVDPEFQLGGLHCVNFCLVLTYLIRTAIMRPLPIARLNINGRSAMRMKTTKDSLRDGICSIRIVVRGRSQEIDFPAV